MLGGGGGQGGVRVIEGCYGAVFGALGEIGAGLSQIGRHRAESMGRMYGSTTEINPLHRRERTWFQSVNLHTIIDITQQNVFLNNS